MTNAIILNETHKFFRYSCILWLWPCFSPCHFLRPLHVYSALLCVFGFYCRFDSIFLCGLTHDIIFFMFDTIKIPQSHFLIFHRISLLFNTHTYTHTRYKLREKTFVNRTNNGQFKKAGIAMRCIMQGLVMKIVFALEHWHISENQTNLNSMKFNPIFVFKNIQCS